MLAVLFIALVIASANAGCTPNNIVTLAQNTPDLSVLVSQLQAANLVDAIAADSPLKTVFAPTNQSFANANLPQTLTTAQLTDILQYHVIPSKITSSQLMATQSPDMLNGAKTTITKGGNPEKVRINNYADVTMADIDACNGVVHIIDHVLIPRCMPARAGVLPNAVALANATADLSTLVDLVVQANLVDTLSDNGPEGQSYTVFAPTNAAFTAANLGTPTEAELTSILTYHVVGRRILSSDLAATNSVETLNGGNLTITVENGNVMVMGARSMGKVVVPNVQGCNAIVHIIDAVLLPAVASSLVPLMGLVVMLALFVMSA